MRIEQLRQEFALDIRYTLFPLHPETPEEGMSLYDLFQGRLNIDDITTRLRQVATELELPFAERTHTYNSRSAQELGKWAEQQGLQESFHDAIYRAYFVDGLNIARIDVLLEVATALGLDKQEAETVLTEHHYSAAVDADWQRARSMGITAVPTSVYSKRKLVGFRPYCEFQKLVST